MPLRTFQVEVEGGVVPMDGIESGHGGTTSRYVRSANGVWWRLGATVKGGTFYLRFRIRNDEIIEWLESSFAYKAGSTT